MKDYKYHSLLIGMLLCYSLCEAIIYFMKCYKKNLHIKFYQFNHPNK